MLKVLFWFYIGVTLCQGRRAPECGGPLDPRNYIITNPGYPSGSNRQSTYPPNTDCEWYYKGHENNTLVSFKFWDMVMEYGENRSNESCEFDYVNITITSIGSRRYCGPHPTVIQGVGSLYVHFHSDRSANYRGFQATFSINNKFNPCDPNPCKNGNCGRTPNKIRAKCDCFPGTTGVVCEIDIQECESDPCSNNATCEDDAELDFYSCDCPPKWKGKNCDIKKEPPCRAVPCVNGGSCNELEDYEYKCDCPDTYQGKNCEIVTGCENPGITYLKKEKRFYDYSTLSFSCKEGFILKGSTNITCFEGKWLQEMPECVRNGTDVKLSAWSYTMIALGTAAAFNAIIFTIWMVYRGPCVESNLSKEIQNRRNVITSLSNTVSMMDDDVFEDDRDDVSSLESAPSYQHV